ncbi:hypothetical protein BAB74_01130 [Mycobacteroides abscessus]|nr:hypothetical protein BAB74_01130 [Mycobacteroides abscessus]
MAFKVWVRDHQENEDPDTIVGPIGYNSRETYTIRDGGVLELIAEDGGITLYAPDRWVKVEAVDHPQRG